MRHDTPLRSAAEPFGLAIFTTDQLLPFQRSDSPEPTAVQELADRQETALSEGLLPRFGVFWICHLEPFHSSASGICLPPDPLPPDCVSPTARHLVGEMQETASSSLNVAPAGAGVDWIFQALPVQRSASGRVPEPEGWSPTAMHLIAFVHETPSSRLPAYGSGTGCTIQPDEVRVSESSCLVVADRAPTAMQPFGEEHETAVNCQVSALSMSGSAAGASSRERQRPGRPRADRRPARSRRELIGRFGGELASRSTPAMINRQAGTCADTDGPITITREGTAAMARSRCYFSC